MSVQTETGDQADIGGEDIGGEETSTQHTAEGAGGPDAGDDTTKEPGEDPRFWQSKYDKAKAQLDRLGRYGSVEEIEQFISNMLPVSNREDFRDYVSGNIGKPAVDTSEDEYLTDEQKEIRDLRAEMSEMRKQLQQNSSVASSELAGVRFERAERDVAEILGPDAWGRQRSAVLSQVQKMAANRQIQMDDVTPKTLMTAFVASFDTIEEQRDAMRFIASRKEAETRETQRRKATTIPDNGVNGEQKLGPPKNIREAIERGIAESREATAG